MNFEFAPTRASVGDEYAFGCCELSFYRHRDRRFWIVNPYGDQSEPGGIYPLARCVMNDFGNLVRTEALPS